MADKLLPRRLMDLLSECHRASFDCGADPKDSCATVARCWSTQDALRDYLLTALKPELLKEKQT